MHLQYLLPHQLKTAIDEGWPLLVPTGCIEYHGPHAALGLDTILVEELLRRVAERVNCVVAPPFWYGPASYAVTGPDQGSVNVSTERFGRHVKDVLEAFWDVGFHWIIVGVHHQQMDGPESLAIRQAAAEVTFEKTHAERGDGWWGKAPLAPNDQPLLNSSTPSYIAIIFSGGTSGKILWTVLKTYPPPGAKVSSNRLT